MQDFETRTRGELRRRNRKFYQTEGDADFREKVSRSIWHSELRLSTCDRILPARRILSFGGDSRLVVCFCWLGKGSLLPEKHPSAAFVNAAFAGESSGLKKPENSEAPFRITFQHGDMGG